MHTQFIFPSRFMFLKDRYGYWQFHTLILKTDSYLLDGWMDTWMHGWEKEKREGIEKQIIKRVSF